MKCSAHHKEDTNGTDKQATVGNLESFCIHNLKSGYANALHREAGIKPPGPHIPAGLPNPGYRWVIQAGSVLPKTKHQSEISDVPDGTKVFGLQ